MNKLPLTLLAGAALISATGAQAQQYPTYNQPQYNQPQYGQPQYQPQYGQQPTGNPLSSIFRCDNPNNRQGTGAIVGGVLGGVIGNQVTGDDDDDELIGTVLGAAIGAGLGSYIGCRMGQGDQQRAETALQTALVQGRSTTWVNPQSGASGRIDIVDTYSYGGGYYAPLPPPVNINTVRWQQGIERPLEYLPSEGVYQAVSNVNLRSGPSLRAGSLGTLRNGETFDGVVRVEGTDWVLASRDGVALGYVSETNLRFLGEDYGRPRQPQYANDPRGASSCRVFDQTFAARGAQPQTTRHTACQQASGEWVITA